MSYCNWGTGNEQLLRYHDEEWGVPVHDDVKQFEYLMMEAMQCGLSWSIVLKKREVFRQCFDGFDYEKIALYTEEDVQRIMSTEGMIRSVPKIRAVINNAKHFIDIRREHGSFCDYIWGYTGGKTVLYENHREGFIPVSNGLSDRIAADLKRRGFKYLGSITVYSHLQACGVINDHDKDCPRYGEINNAFPTTLWERDNEHGVTEYRTDREVT